LGDPGCGINGLMEGWRVGGLEGAIFDVGYSIFDIRFSIFDVGYSIFNIASGWLMRHLIL